MADDDLYVPRPVALVAGSMERIQDLQLAYLAARDSREPAASLTEAIYAVLTESEAAEVIAFANGDHDGTYGEGAGAKLVQSLLGPFERLYQLQLPGR